MASPFEQLARTRKATAIADGIWRIACEDSPPRDDLPEYVAGLDQEDRDSLAREFGQHPCSADSWDEVVKLLRGKMTNLRQALAHA